MGKYLEDAKAMYAHARIELEQWRQSRDEIVLRDASEKTWGAVTLATNELLEFAGRRAPSGTGDWSSELNAIERNNRRLRRMRMLERFAATENILHKDCFYDGYCPLPLITDVIDSAGEYIGDVETLVSGRSL